MFTAMKRFHNFLTANLLLWACSLFMTSCEKEDVPPPIDLNTLCKTYESNELRLFLNGVEYTSSEEQVAIIFPHTLKSETKYHTNEGQMLLEILPIFPEIRYSFNDAMYINPIVIVDVVSTSKEITLRGNYADSEYYNLNIEGSYKNEVLTLNLTYNTYRPNITGQAFIFDLTDESIDLSKLHPTKELIEYEGIQYPIREFVLDAISPILSNLREQFGGAMRIKFFEDGSTQIGIKKENSSEYTDIPGKHGYFFHETEWGYLSADAKGMEYLAPILDGTTNILMSDFYAWRARQTYFASVHFSLTDNNDLLMTMEEPLMFAFNKYISSYWQKNKKLLSESEIDKMLLLSSLFDKGQINLILFRGTKE